MNKIIKNLLCFAPIATFLTSCSSFRIMDLLPEEYYIEEPVVLKQASSSTSDPYELTLKKFSVNIDEIDEETHAEIKDANKSINKQIDEINKDSSKTQTEKDIAISALSAQRRSSVYLNVDNEQHWYEFNFYMSFMVKEKTQDQPIVDEPESVRISSTYVGEYNRKNNTYYFLLDKLDPSYIGEVVKDNNNVSLLFVFYNDLEDYKGRLSAKVKDNNSTYDRWVKEIKFVIDEE